MNLPTMPQETLLKLVGLLLVVGLIYSYGYFKGYESQSKATERALQELVESEKALALVASQQASRDAQKIAQGRGEASTIRREYEEAKPHEVDPVRCVSDDQRSVLKALADSTQ